MASFNAALAIDPRDATAHADRGSALSQLSADPADVLAALDAALAIAPRDTLAHASRSRGLTVLGRHAEARLAFGTREGLHGQRCALSTAEAEILPCSREEATPRGAREGSGSAAPTLALALAARGGSLENDGRGQVGAPARRQMAPVAWQTNDGGAGGRGGGGASEGARFRFVQVYGPPHSGTSSLAAELNRLFGSKLCVPEWPVGVCGGRRCLIITAHCATVLCHCPALCARPAFMMRRFARGCVGSTRSCPRCSGGAEC